MKACVNLNDTLTDPESAFSTSADHSPFVRTHGTSLFGYYDTVSKKTIYSIASLPSNLAPLIADGRKSQRCKRPCSGSWDILEVSLTLPFTAVCSGYGGMGRSHWQGDAPQMSVYDIPEDGMYLNTFFPDSLRVGCSTSRCNHL